MQHQEHPHAQPQLQTIEEHVHREPPQQQPQVKSLSQISDQNQPQPQSPKPRNLFVMMKLKQKTQDIRQKVLDKVKQKRSAVKEEPKKRFIRTTRKLILIMHFIKLTKQQAHQKSINTNKYFYYFKKMLWNTNIILLPDSFFKRLWNLLLFLMIPFSAWVTPYDIFFMTDYNEHFYTIEYCIDIFFGMDIIINFISAYYDEHLVIVDDFKKIARKYLTTWFLLDVVMVFPFFLFFQDYSKLKLIRLFRIIKFYDRKQKFIFIDSRESGILNNILHFFNIHAGIQKLIKIYFLLFLIAHLFSCFWYLSHTLFEDSALESWVSGLGLQNESKFYLYITGMYWSTQTVSSPPDPPAARATVPPSPSLRLTRRALGAGSPLTSSPCCVTCS